jgi:type I restriction enzyme S subunit
MRVDALLDVLPSGWKRSQVGELLLSASNGITYRNFPESGGLPISRIQTISYGVIDFGSVGYAGLEHVAEKYLMKDGDLLFSHINSLPHLGKVAIYKNTMPPLVHGMNLLRLRCVSEVDSSYIFYAFQNLEIRQQIWNRAQHAVNQASINIKQLSAVLVPVAPLAEQKKIVEILEEQLSRLDAALASVRAVREKSARFRRSLLHAAFSGALTSQDVSIGISSRGWTHKKLSDLCDVRDGTHDSPKPSEAGHPLVTSKNIKNGRLDLEKTYLICDSDFDEINLRSKVDKFDLLIGMIGTVGEVCIVTVEPNFAIKNVGLIKTGDEELSRLIRFFLLSPQGEEQITKATSGTTQRFIPLGKLRLLDIPLPPRVEMLKMFEILEEQLSRLDASLEIADVIEKKASALRRSLLHAAFSGNLTKEWREAAYV